MDFNLVDSSLRCRIGDGKSVTNQIPYVFYPETPESSDFEHSAAGTLTSIPQAAKCNYTHTIAPYGGVILSPSERRDSMEAMRETIFRMAMMQPIQIDPESVKPPSRKNVRISKDPQSVAARQRRERISQRIRILQRMVPGGTKLDTASMLDEAVHYLKFLKNQVQSLERAGAGLSPAVGYQRFS